jgi:hypothetical protein
MKAQQFWNSAKARHELAKAGLKWVGKHLHSYDSMTRAYAGQYWLEGGDPETDSPENAALDWISFFVPRAASNPPKFRVSTRRGGWRARFEAKGYEVALNQLVRDIRLQQFIADYPSVDMQFVFGATLATRTADTRRRARDYPFASNEERTMPSIYRVAPTWYFEDPSAWDRDGIQFQGWAPYEVRARMLALADEDDTWDKRALEAAAPIEYDQNRPAKDRNRPDVSEWMPMVRSMRAFAME